MLHSTSESMFHLTFQFPNFYSAILPKCNSQRSEGRILVELWSGGLQNRLFLWNSSLTRVETQVLEKNINRPTLPSPYCLHVLWHGDSLIVLIGFTQMVPHIHLFYQPLFYFMLAFWMNNLWLSVRYFLTLPV